jgi:hypothetical protein
MLEHTSDTSSGVKQNMNPVLRIKKKLLLWGVQITEHIPVLAEDQLA